MKRLAKILIIPLILVLVGWGGYRLYFYMLYADSLEQQKTKWINEIFIPSKIEGVVYEFNEPRGKNCFSNLIIKKKDGEKFASGVCLCDNDDFLNFVTVGDSVIKATGSYKIVVTKSDGQKKEFDFPFCDD